jgi:hypothetical protein
MSVVFVVSSFVLGYYIGKRVGIAQTMLRMEGIIADLQNIEYMFKRWKEDKL